jgi:DNA-directed RNA polymerase subunit RPC12/RpoP
MNTVEVGANLGEQLAVAEQEAGHHVEVSTAPPAPEIKRDVTLRLVGVELVPAEAGRVTLDAQEQHVGRILTGPEAGMAGLLDYAEFLGMIQVREFKLNRFRVDQSTGRISRGSMVSDPSGVYVCPACKAEFKLTPAEVKKARQRQRTDKPVCRRCDAQAQLQWRHTPPPPLGAGEPISKRLFETFQAGAQGELTETPYLIPRIWSVYPTSSAPSEWAPEQDDVMAGEIMKREAEIGMTIRPFTHAFSARSQTLQSLILESTTEAPGQPGMAVGWLSQAALNGRLSDEYGYTVRLLSARKRRKASSYAV